MFDNNKLGEIRPNQLITTFGSGSIVDAVKDSVTVLDLNYWKEKGKKIIDGRLASYLGVDCFYMPRTSYSGDIPVVSFPYMHVCSNVKCGRIFDLRENFDLDRYLKFGVTCPECHRQAYPSRFITICENGHMDDFPWSWWVHGGNTTCKGTMRMYSTGNTSTLADMWVECSCGARRSMSGATQHENFEGMKCSGHHPFRPNHKNEKCDKEMIPSQRGASNVYFPVMRSAISIPPWINPLYNLIDEHLRLIDSYEEDFGEMGLDKVYQKYFSAFTREEFDAALLRRRQNIKEFTEIKQMEYNAIGGLVELGNIAQLIVLMKDAFQEALVCTNDPECLNNVPAGNNSNGAACHSCCMISETACENGNRMLDRGLIVPIDGRENQSYFKTLVEELCQLEV